MATDRLFPPGYAAQERQISFSELGCVLFDLERIGDEAAIGNAKAALMRVQLGIPDHEAWMREEPAGCVWEMEVQKIQGLLGEE